MCIERFYDVIMTSIKQFKKRIKFINFFLKRLKLFFN